MRTYRHGGPPELQHAVQVVENGITKAGGGIAAVILVEGQSDRRAVEAFALRCGRDLRAEGIEVVPMGGATNIGHFLDYLGPAGLGLRLAGICDAGEESHFRRAFERAGLGRGLSRADLEELGFYVCLEDLEDELIRALGVTRVQEIIDAQGELRSFRTLQSQPAHRGRTIDRQLRRFFGSHSGHKSRYATLLVDALDQSCAPPPLERLLAHI